MCGICGIYNFNTDRSIDSHLLERMTDIMRHRGPDDRGTFIDGHIGLGHRRLSIIDLETGNQPMSNLDGSVWIVFNGETYNFKELRRLLKEKGYRFRTHSDTEVIINSYLEYGKDCVSKFNGMFAFAIYDKRNAELLLARDRLGIKPLYYYVDDNCFIFGSEIKAILEHSYVTKGVDTDSVVEYLSLRYTLGDNTLFKNIKELPPGSLLVASKGAVEIRKYWELSANKVEIAFDEAVNRTESLFRDSVKKRMISDVPIGAFLSGGLDSSAIVSIMAKESKTVKTISIGFDEGEQYNELEYARLLSRRYYTDHHEIVLDMNDYLSTIERLIWHRDSPLEVKNEIAIYFMAKELKNYFTVVLSGEGADELFAGYPKYNGFDNKLRLLKLASLFPYALNCKLAIGVSGLLKKGRTLRKIANTAKNSREIENLLLSNAVRLETTSIFNSKLKRSYEKMEEKLNGFFSNLNGMDFHNKFLHYDLTHHLPSLLMRIDRMTMAASVEARVPFLDHRLLEFVSSLPYNYKYNKKKKVRKYILKTVFADKLPPEIVRRKKMGFPVPMDNWLQSNSFRKCVVETILDERALARGYFDRSNLMELCNKPEDNEEILWRLFNLELWHRVFIDC